jgi:ribosomal protein L23
MSKPISKAVKKLYEIDEANVSALTRLDGEKKAYV